MECGDPALGWQPRWDGDVLLRWDVTAWWELVKTGKKMPKPIAQMGCCTRRAERWKERGSGIEPC